MMPTPETFLAKLKASPVDAAAFDRCSPNITRREHVEAVLRAVTSTIAESKALRAKLAASRAKIAALETARILNARLTSQITLARNRVASAKAKPSPASTSSTPLADRLAALTGSEQSTFYRQHSRALRIEAMLVRHPNTITI